MLTKKQRELMEHTISGPDRNWFGTNLGCDDGKEFNELVRMGYASIECAPDWSGDDIVYRLTPRGKEALKYP